MTLLRPDMPRSAWSCRWSGFGCFALYAGHVPHDDDSPKAEWLDSAPLGPPYDVLRREAYKTGAVDEEPWTWEHAPSRTQGRDQRAFLAQFRRRLRHRSAKRRIAGRQD
jgi:hypothetical protein